MFEEAAIRVGSPFVHACGLQGERVRECDMTAAVKDNGRMIRRGPVQLFASNGMLRLTVVVEKTQHPFSGRSFVGTLSQRGHDLRDRGSIARHHPQMLPSRRGRMRMGIDEAGQNRPPY